MKGSLEALDDPQSDVCSIYSPKYVSNVRPTIDRLKPGNALFTFPATLIKCAGAAQKICYVAQDVTAQVVSTQ